MSRHDPDCTVPVPHRHRKPTEKEVEESVYWLAIEHPPTCAWRRDVYSGCSCGVLGLTMQLEDLMRPKVPA